VGIHPQGGLDHPLILHWNGSSWKQSAVPHPGIAGNLADVDGTSARNIWAVGSLVGGTAPQTLVLRWNGKQWARVSSPDPGGNGPGQDNVLLGVAATSATNAWAVGAYTSATGLNTLVLAWNGRKWSREPSPSPGHVFAQLVSVAAISATRAWAVGSFRDAADTESLALHCC